MTTQNALKKLSKWAPVERLGNRYIAKKENRIISFIDQAGEAVNIHMRYANDHDDLQSDYHAGWYPPSMKYAIDSANRSIEASKEA